MAFWAERFKHDDEEDMWEELRQIRKRHGW